MRSKIFDRYTSVWFGTILFTVLLLYFQKSVPWLFEYPDQGVWPFADLLNYFMNFIVAHLGQFFLGISWLLEFPIQASQLLLHSLPWAVTVFLFSALAYVASGLGLSIFTVLATLYMVVIGYWEESMNTLALVLISVPLAILVGFAIGIWGFFSARAKKIIMPLLDIFQTVPTFAYLLPILLLFGFGTVLGLIASVVYSFPPMVRNTILGLQRVPDEIIESGIMAGATPSQLFWQVRVPASRRQLMLGVNQTTMASFSMVIIASIIGGTADIGWTVLYYIRKAEVGESLLVGIVIALMAIIIDRITASFASRSDQVKPKTVNFLIKGQYGFIILFCALVLWIAATYFNFLDATNVKYGAGVVNYIDKSFEDFVKEYRSAIKVLKTYALFYIMLPVKIGLQEAVSPYTWGFSLTSIHLFLYFGSMIGISILLLVLGNKKLSISLILFMIFFYFGLTKMPWIGLILIYSLGCWQVGGIKLGLGAALGLCFIVVCGVWSEAMISAYLCGIAVIISFLVGSVLGVWAAHNNIISSVIRPINDTLQTMPLFVILIPFVMLFKIGDFTALLAIIAYAIVPAIRYAEHGIRNLPETVIESARMMGATKRQLFWQVELPLALPVIMIGLNQTIMYGIAMLVITALVGTNGLEQIVYIGLNDGNFGVGMVAGISMAIIAIITDRATKAWSVARGRQLDIKSL
ncbi:MAG: glycine/betaine ABC transporter permease [Rhodobacteraceae bacterium]|nr:MAG: glycine/betaine ABC transporter permease [Paracoccaceae bacterium]